MLPQRATFEDGSFGVEAGVAELLTRMQTGRFKVFGTSRLVRGVSPLPPQGWLIVKSADDLMSATRYGVMMRRHAVLQNIVVKSNNRGRGAAAPGWDEPWHKRKDATTRRARSNEAATLRQTMLQCAAELEEALALKVGVMDSENKAAAINAQRMGAMQAVAARLREA
jgi:hypothetical protein